MITLDAKIVFENGASWNHNNGYIKLTSATISAHNSDSTSEITPLFYVGSEKDTVSSGIVIQEYYFFSTS